MYGPISGQINQEGPAFFMALWIRAFTTRSGLDDLNVTMIENAVFVCTLLVSQAADSIISLEKRKVGPLMKIQGHDCVIGLGVPYAGLTVHSRWIRWIMY